MKDTVLVITSTVDRSVDSVLIELEKMREHYFRLDTDMFPKDIRLDIHFSGDEIDGYLIRGEDTLEFDRIKSCWYRRSARSRGLGDMPEAYAKFIKKEARAALWSLYTNLDVFWMNHPLLASRLLEDNKLYQLRLAAESGLQVPQTLITNRPDELLRFCGENEGVLALKAISGQIFLDHTEEEILALYTQRVTGEQIREHISGVELAPILAQEYVPKSVELRVTVVHKEIFACAIYSQESEKTKHDWRRYDFENVVHESYQVPEEGL